MSADGNTPEYPVFHRSCSLAREVILALPIGFAQVLLQPSHIVGLAFLAGAFWNSWIIASVGVAGCIVGTLTAVVLGYPKEERRSGLYGFNGALVGLACPFFYEFSLPLLLLVVFGGVASSIIMRVMLRAGFKPFTFPFVAVTWLIFAVLSATSLAEVNPGHSQVTHDIVVWEGLLRGAGQVLFQESLVTGLIFLLAIAARDLIQGMYALLAASLGLIGGSLLGFPVDAINLGLFGYNGVLCAILFSGPRIRDLVSAIAAILLSISLVRLFHVVGLPAFTFPFVLAAWVVLWAKRRLWADEERT